MHLHHLCYNLLQEDLESAGLLRLLLVYRLLNRSLGRGGAGTVGLLGRGGLCGGLLSRSGSGGSSSSLDLLHGSGGVDVGEGLEGVGLECAGQVSRTEEFLRVEGLERRRVEVHSARQVGLSYIMRVSVRRRQLRMYLAYVDGE